MPAGPARIHIGCAKKGGGIIGGRLRGDKGISASQTRQPVNQKRGIRWNDPALGIDWPVGAEAAVLSATAIDDNQIATSTTYSSNKIVSLLDALKADILGGADAAYDTLVEIQQLLQNGTTGLDALLAAVNLRVRFDAAQTLTVAEQLQARTNIGAVAASDVGNTDTDFVAIFDGALA